MISGVKHLFYVPVGNLYVFIQPFYAFGAFQFIYI